MAPFLGTDTYAIDDKGRIAIPPAYRGGRASARAAREKKPATFVLMAGFEGCLMLHSPEGWERLEQKLQKISLNGRDGRAFVRAFLKDVTLVSVDGQGRITIPPALRSRAGLGKEAVLHGIIDRIEIWDPERFEAEIQGQQSLEELAEAVLKD